MSHNNHSQYCVEKTDDTDKELIVHSMQQVVGKRCAAVAPEQWVMQK